MISKTIGNNSVRDNGNRFRIHIESKLDHSVRIDAGSLIGLLLVYESNENVTYEKVGVVWFL
jgi:hypothetical protein